MRPIRHLLLPLLLLVCAFPAASGNNEFLIQKYQKQLSRTTNARDSLRILYDIFDLSSRKQQNTTAWQIYETAGRADDETAQADILRHLAVFNYRNDSIINILIRRAEEISNEERRNATRTFIVNQRVSTLNSRDALEYLEHVMKDADGNMKKPEDHTVYDKICILHHILHYLGSDAQGALFNETIAKYQELIESLPASDYPLKNQFYTTAAIIYSKYGDYPSKAVEADLHLLNIIESLEKLYRNKNRNFRNYDPQKFVCYRRILSNYPDLTSEEVEMTYDSIMVLSDRNSDVNNTMSHQRQTDIYYYMAKKDYAKAIPALKHYIEYRKQDPPYLLMKQYKMLVEATREYGDRASYTDALEKYIIAKEQLDSLHDAIVKKEVIIRDSLQSFALFMDPDASADKKQRSGSCVPVSYYVISSLLTVLLCIFVTLYVKLRMRK